MKFVLNKCYGGFSLSKEACDILHCNSYDYGDYYKRSCEELIEVVEKLGDNASGKFAKLRVVEIPDEATDYLIDEYDGAEKLTFVVDGRIYFA